MHYRIKFQSIETEYYGIVLGHIYLNLRMKFIYTVLLVCSAFSLNAQLSKKIVIENINEWYEAHGDVYKVEVKGSKASADITRYHPERPDEKDDIIEVNYQGMEIQLKFDKPFSEIGTSVDSLQKYFSYVSLHNIYNTIPSDGWDIYPRTGMSALRGTGVVFTSGGESLSFTLNWSAYSIMGYRDSKKCHQELEIADGSVSETCYVSVEKNIKLEITVSGLILKQ
jgi:hypothetical protein